MGGTLRSLVSKLHPALAAGLLSGTAMSGGDVVAQKIHGQSLEAPVNWERTRRFGFLGLAFTGPYFLYGYNWVDSVFKASPPGIAVALKKTAFSHFTIVPVFISILVTSNQLLEGRSLQQSMDKLRAVFLPTYLTGSAFWPFIQVINFTLIPTSVRLLYLNSASLVWNVYLSAMTNGRAKPAATTATDTAS